MLLLTHWDAAVPSCHGKALVLVPDIWHWGENREEAQSLEKTCSGEPAASCHCVAADARNSWRTPGQNHTLSLSTQFKNGVKKNPKTQDLHWNLGDCIQMSLPIERNYDKTQCMKSISGISHPVSEDSWHWMPALVRSWKGKCIIRV